MYAVFQINSKQYRVVIGQYLYIERIKLNIDEKVEFNQVLLLRKNQDIQIGNPFIKNGKIIAKVIEHSLSNKVKIIKFRRRKHFKKIQGHRQCVTKIKIMEINSICSFEI